MCVYDEQPIAGRDIQCQAPDSRSRYTTPFDDYKVMCKHVNNPGSDSTSKLRTVWLIQIFKIFEFNFTKTLIGVELAITSELSYGNMSTCIVGSLFNPMFVLG